MKKKNKYIILTLFFCFFLPLTNAFPNTYNNIVIVGNERISNETILMFSKIENNTNINDEIINNTLKNLYETNFFKDVSIEYENNQLIINVKELPIINNINYNGIKAKKIKDVVFNDLILRSRSSFSKFNLKKDKEKIIFELRNLGYYFSKVDILTEDLEDNKIDLTFNITLGDKSKIKKITFLGDKIFKSGKLKSLIISEEYKFWKFLSSKKYLNENLIEFDKRLLKNFYLNKGYYNVEINTSFAKYINDKEFELIFNIDAKDKIFFGKLDITLPVNFDSKNFDNLNKLFSELEGVPYSINLIDKILDEIDIITVNEEYLTANVLVNENIASDKINLNFIIEESDAYIVEKINILGNNVTRENVIRNQFEIDEGDFYNKILERKTINNIKSLNFFKKVESETIDGSNNKSKIINISVEEKPTGEISAGAGAGTNGTTVMFGVKENNYLGKGMSVNTNVTINTESIKGIFSVYNRNFKNTDKSIFADFQAIETDRLVDFGYKTNKAGFRIGTNFEYLKYLNLGLSTSAYFEKIETDSSASERQKKQKGNYTDSFFEFDFDYDKRNQKFQTSDGFRSFYSLKLPVISDTNTLTNTYNYQYFSELFENNITNFSIYLQSANSISNDNIKLSERLFIPSRKLRGFKVGKVGPKDGNDFIGGNYLSTLNISSSVPKILENAQNIDVLVFFDAANIWGIDYSSALNDGNKIRSSLGIGIDWITPIGPLNFSLSQPITKHSSDITETFRFNLGTTF
jgi:outer membrane protein insertion porin family